MQGKPLEAFRTFEHEGMVLELFECDPGVAWSAEGTARRIPGAGRANVDGLEVSTRDGWVDFAARIVGTNIAYVYIEVSLKDPDVERYYGPVAREHVLAARHQVVRGRIQPGMVRLQREIAAAGLHLARGVVALLIPVVDQVVRLDLDRTLAFRDRDVDFLRLAARRQAQAEEDEKTAQKEAAKPHIVLSEEDRPWPLPWYRENPSCRGDLLLP